MKNQFKQKRSFFNAAWLTVLLLTMTFGAFRVASKPAPPPSPPPPTQAYFTESPQTGCAPLLVHFFNASEVGTYAWNFGDTTSGSSDTSSFCGPFHVYNTPGTYTVRIIVNGVFTHTDVITVLPSPTPVITGSLTGCQGIATSYTYSVPFVAGTSYVWTVSGGSYSVLPGGNSIVVTWSSAGTNDITVTETNASGCNGIDDIKVNVAPLPDLSSYLPCGTTKRVSDPPQGNGTNPAKGDTTSASGGTTPACICANSIQTYNSPGDGNFYTWHITNGKILSEGPNGNTVTIKWGKGGTACITLIDSNIFGCQDSATCCFSLCPGPNANFSITSTPACLGTSILFSAVPIVGGGTYSWAFGDGSTATGINANYTYAAPGTYNVTLTVTNSTGCTGDTTLAVTVINGNAPHIFCPGSVCGNSQATYWTPFVPGASYHWHIVGGTTSDSTSDTVHVLWGPGPVATVTLLVTGTSVYTCPQPVTVSIPILSPVPPISGTTIVCVGTSYTYSTEPVPGSDYTWTVTGAVSVIPSGNTVTIVWDGSASGTITLDVKNDLLCCKGHSSLVIVKKPVLTISGPPSGCQNAMVTFTTPGVNCNWTITGGTPVSSGIGTNFFTVTLGTGSSAFITATPVVSGVYCNSPASTSITIVPPPLPATFTGPTMVCLGATDAYTVTVPVGGGSTWAVTGGALSGTTTTTTNVTWTTPGTNILSVTQTNSTGCITVTKYTVYVIPSAVGPIHGPSVACVHDTKMYTFPLPAGIPVSAYTWSVIGGNIIPGPPSDSLFVQWGFSGNGTVTLTNTVCNTSVTYSVTVYDTATVVVSQILHCTPFITLKAVSGAGDTIQWSGHPAGIDSINISSPGSYTVKVTNAGGCVNTKTINLFSIPTLPIPSSVITVTSLVSPTFPFLDEFCVPAVAGNTYHWSSGETTPCIFVHDTLPRTVVVTGSDGCTSTSKDSVPGGGGSGGCPTCPPPPCSISANCPVTTLTAGAGTGYSWTTPGGPRTGNPISVGAAGTYTVIYTDTHSRVDTCSYFYPGPLPSILIHASSTCDPITFTDLGGAAAYYYWDFGDSTYSNNPSPTHTYAHVGPHTVTLWISMDKTCWINASISFNVKTIVHAGFKVTLGCTPTVLFTNTSHISGAGPVSYFWQFGDASTSTAVNPTHVYTSGGTYMVILTETGGPAGCTSVDTQIVNVPQLNAFINTCGVGCLNESVQFESLSIHTSPIVSYEWVFDGHDSSSLENPWYTFTTTGPHIVKLTIKDSRGCRDTIQDTFNVAPFTPGTITPSGPVSFCSGGHVVLMAPPGFAYIWSTGATTPSIVVTSTGSYFVTVVSPTGCTAKLGPISVSVQPTPVSTITLGGPNPFCSGNTLTLFGPLGSGFVYKWYKNGIVYPSVADHITLSAVTDAGIYSLVVSNGFGCKDSSAGTNIIVNPSPLIYINPSPVSWLCPGSSISLSVVNYGTVTISSYLWNTGATSPSIIVSHAGTYTVTVVGVDGCTATATYILNAAPLPDFSNIPSGCYTICAGQIDTIRGPSGAYTYRWYNGATVIATTQNLILPGAGTYFLVVHDLSYGCTDTSQMFSVTTTAAPVAHITASGPLVICSGSGGSLILSATKGTGYSYLWTVGGVIAGTGSSITVTTAGTYVLTVHTSNCCFAKDSVTVEAINCCFAVDSVYKTIPDGDSIFTDQVWAGKYYIAGKVHVFGTATLDVTVDDLVFSQTGEIIFHDKSFLRANNSVFRPCQINSTWVGLTFLDSSAGYIYTNTFKNATVALNILSTDSGGVKIVDNTFSQCQNAVYIDRGGNQYSEGITGNSFVIDDDSLPFASNDYFGISLNNVTMNEMITQNIFRNANMINAPKNYYGVFAQNSSATVSANTFTNMHRSFDVQSAINFFSIENNTMEINQSVTINDYQVRISGSGVPVLVIGNTITNSLPNTPATAAIYAENENLLNVNGNHIVGFDIGIQLESVVLSQILENSIENTKTVGIYLDYAGGLVMGSDVDIACNTIHMDQTNTSFSQPFGVFINDADSSSKVRTNCIFDCYNAIYLQTSATNPQIPTVKNNFLYNYIYAGINNNGYIGGIGVGAPPFGKAGRNTFVRNDFSAADIRSTSPLLEGGNFNATTLVGSVSAVGTPNLYNSTADCGVQINYVNLKVSDQTIDNISICDHFDQELYPFLGTDPSGEFVLKNDFQNGFAAYKSSPMAIAQLTSALVTIANKTNMTTATTFYNAAMASGILQGNAAKWFAYDFAYMGGNFAQAATIVNSIAPANADEGDLQDIEQIRLHLIMTSASVKKLNSDEKSILSAIDVRRGLYAPIARDILQLNATGHDYIFKKVTLPNLPALNPGNAVNAGDNYLEAYPNPVHDKLTVKYSLQNVTTHSLKVTDVLGKNVQDVPLTYTATEMVLDVNNLAPGAYVIYIDDGNAQHIVRFMKQ